MPDNDEPYVFPTPTLDDDLALLRYALRMRCDPRNTLGVAPAVDALNRVAAALGCDVSGEWPHGSRDDF